MKPSGRCREEIDLISGVINKGKKELLKKNLKFEARNPNFETISNDKKFKLRLGIETWDI
jgi:hypothetical protein